MPGRSRLAASAVVGSLMLLGTPGISSAQRTGASLAQPVGRLVAFSPGAIHGVVRDETGTPVAGATVSVVGPTTGVAVTDRDGRFELRTLSPGPYLVHAHLSGYVAPRAQVIQVSSNGRTASSIALRRVGAATILAASVGAGLGKVGLPVIRFTIPCAYTMRAGTLLGRLSATRERWVVLMVVDMMISVSWVGVVQSSLALGTSVSSFGDWRAPS